MIEKMRQLHRSVRAAMSAKQPSVAFAGYLEKVATRAYTVTDEEVEALLASGHGEDEIFEATVDVALRVAIERYEAGLEALGKASD
jgi:hypothetical protein